MLNVDKYMYVCMHACMHACMYVCMYSVYVQYVCMYLCIYVCFFLADHCDATFDQGWTEQYCGNCTTLYLVQQ